jgi:hypothetical protein
MVGLWYLLAKRPGHALPRYVAAAGAIRTLTLAGWTYVTSTEDHDLHDIFMIAYLVLTLPWTVGCITFSPHNPRAARYRKWFAGAFFGSLVPMIYFYLQHKVYQIPGGMVTNLGSSNLASPKFYSPTCIPRLKSIIQVTNPSSPCSIHDLFLLRMGPHPFRHRLRCRHRPRFLNIRGSSYGCEGHARGVREMVADMSSLNTIIALRNGACLCRHPDIFSVSNKRRHGHVLKPFTNLGTLRRYPQLLWRN